MTPEKPSSYLFAQSSWPGYLRRRVQPFAIAFLAWNLLHAIYFRVLRGWPIRAGKTLWYQLTGYIHLWFVFVLLQFILLHKALQRHLDGNGATLLFLAAAAMAITWYAFSSGLLWLQGERRPVLREMILWASPPTPPGALAAGVST